MGRAAASTCTRRSLKARKPSSCGRGRPLVEAATILGLEEGRRPRRAAEAEAERSAQRKKDSLAIAEYAALLGGALDSAASEGGKRGRKGGGGSSAEEGVGPSRRRPNGT